MVGGLGIFSGSGVKILTEIGLVQIVAKEDIFKQEEMRNYYDTSKYYENHKRNFADQKNRFKEYFLRNVFNIYYPQKNEKILDIGCGWGNLSLALQKRRFDVTGLDYSRKSIEVCKNTARLFNLDESKFICRDATDTKFDPNAFDVVFAADLVEHLFPEVYLNLVKEVYNILKNGGKFIIYTPNPQHFFEILKKNNLLLKRDITHVDYKTMNLLKGSLNANGFFIKKAYYMESHVPFLSQIEKLFIDFIPIFRRRIAVLAIKK